VGVPYKDANKRREYQRERKRLRRAGDSVSTPASTRLPLDFRATTAADLLAVLGEQIEAVRAAEGGVFEKARTVGFLVNVGLRAVELANVVARLEAIEGALKHRGSE
jgi:hypothetical protein